MTTVYKAFRGWPGLIVGKATRTGETPTASLASASVALISASAGHGKGRNHSAGAVLVAIPLESLLQGLH